MRWPDPCGELHQLAERPACCGQAPRSVAVRMSWLLRLVMALRLVPERCGQSAHGAAGLVVLVVLDALARLGRRASPLGRVVGMLLPGVAIRGGANVLACAPGDVAAVGAGAVRSVGPWRG